MTRACNQVRTPSPCTHLVGRARRARCAKSRAGNRFWRKKNRWEPIVSAMSKKKLHTYCVFETPNRYNPIVVTGQFAFLHTLQYFWEVIFPFLHTLHGFWEVILHMVSESSFPNGKTIFEKIYTTFTSIKCNVEKKVAYVLHFRRSPSKRPR